MVFRIINNEGIFVSENNAQSVKKRKLFASSKSNETDASISDTLTPECETRPNGWSRVRQ